MKLKTLLKPALLTLAVLTVAGQPARAAQAFVQGDLLLGFRATGATNDYVLNLGQASQFTTTSILSFTLAGLSTDLSNNAVFGSTWYNRSDLFWSITGGTSAPNTLFATAARTNVGVQSTPLQRRGGVTQGSTLSQFNANAQGYQLSNPATLPTGSIQSVSFPNAYVNYAVDGNDFGWADLEASFANGTAGSVLDLYRLDPSASGGDGIFLGSFSFNNSGVLSFYGASAVPEPSTYALLGLGLGALAVLRLRKRGTTES